jgi:hypothetical protein
MVSFKKIEQIYFQGDSICMKLDDKVYCVPLHLLSTKLASATDTERSVFFLSPSGYGIHWPVIDEDLSIEGIIRVAGTLP